MTTRQDMIRATFSWGPVREIHTIREYDIVETLSSPGKDPRPGFHVYVGGKDTCRYTHCLDSAILTALAYKHDGANSQAQVFMSRMLGIDTE